MRLMITGAAGQLGRDLQEALADHDLIPLDHVALDVADRDSVGGTVDRIRPEWVINAAAFNDVDGAESQPHLAVAINGAGAGYLAEAATRVGARMLHISSDYVFDGKKGTPYTEADPPDPLSVYGRSKLEGERRVLATSPSACVIRTAWLYGRHGKNFVGAILAAVARGGPVDVVADQMGSPTWTMDLANGIDQLLQTNASGLFHVVNAGHCSRFEFAQAIVPDPRAVRPTSAAQAARPAPRPANSSLESVRWQAAGLRPLRPWRVALDAYLRRPSIAPPD